MPAPASEDEPALRAPLLLGRSAASNAPGRVALEAAVRRVGGGLVDAVVAPGRARSKDAATAALAACCEAFGRGLLIDVGGLDAATRPGAEVFLADCACHSPGATLVALAVDAQAMGLCPSIRRNQPACPLGPDAAGADARIAALRLGVAPGASLDADRLVATALRFEAFRHTTYLAEAPDGPIPIRIGRRHPAVDALLERRGAEAWVFVTAYNPHARLAAPEDNEAAQERLREELAGRAVAVLPGAGHGDLGDWPAEPSFLALGVSADDAGGLAARYAQAAVVVGRRGEAARLLLPRAPRARG